MTAHSELIEKVKYCRRLSPGNFELLQAEIIAALSDTVQISRDDANAEIERLEKINAEMLGLLIATKRDIYPPLNDWPDDSPLKTSAKNYRRLSAWIFSSALARDFPTGTGETNERN